MAAPNTAGDDSQYQLSVSPNVKPDEEDLWSDDDDDLLISHSSTVHFLVIKHIKSQTCETIHNERKLPMRRWPYTMIQAYMRVSKDRQNESRPCS